MDQKQLLKQMIELNQTTFKNIFDVTVLVQDQFERTANTVLDQIPGLPAEGRKSIENWAEVIKYSRDSFKQQMDNGFDQAEKLLAI
jgi:uncharacterized protein